MIMPGNEDIRAAFTVADDEFITDLAVRCVDVAREHDRRIVELCGALEFVRYRLCKAVDAL